MRRHLPVLDETLLDRIDIASPCPADWERMRGDDRSRFCGQCRQHVYDLSAMTRAEAAALIAEKEGRVCVRLRRRPDGRVVTTDCGERLRAARRRGLLPFVAALALLGLMQLGLKLAGLQLAWHWLTEDRPPTVEELPRLQGEMMVVPDAVPLPTPEVVEMGAPMPIEAEPPPTRMGKIKHRAK